MKVSIDKNTLFAKGIFMLFTQYIFDTILPFLYYFEVLGAELEVGNVTFTFVDAPAGVSVVAGTALLLPIFGHTKTTKSTMRTRATTSPITTPADESSVVPEGLLMIVAIRLIC